MKPNQFNKHPDNLEDDSPFDEIWNLLIELAGAVFAIATVALIVGMLVGYFES